MICIEFFHKNFIYFIHFSFSKLYLINQKTHRSSTREWNKYWSNKSKLKNLKEYIYNLKEIFFFFFFFPQKITEKSHVVSIDVGQITEHHDMKNTLYQIGLFAWVRLYISPLCRRHFVYRSLLPLNFDSTEFIVRCFVEKFFCDELNVGDKEIRKANTIYWGKRFMIPIRNSL